MLAIQKSKSHKGQCTPNVLPCRVNHNGPVNASKRYWEVRTSVDNKPTSYFRGRKLHGKKLKMPKGYRGIVVSSTDRILPADGDGDGEGEESPEVKVMEEQAGFRELMIWGHEALPDGLADPYVRGVEEWVAFAEQIHLLSDDDEEVEEKEREKEKNAEGNKE
ncbi:Uncharacterized protein LHYA1_G005726 [Lachnellula hyalina]|uniref:Uncharacterized protein n=1 Tax=Lachnellula hyalina TaxID=1316788 RepID=A0A8H8TXF9_9HELO|nr:Uncharacterized protein LHYA1_G005726 [Lachnellula hyalina]TVY25482.1 Uncharacterized protein LHYA1_G005726 [Lachnellula hyalina]